MAGAVLEVGRQHIHAREVQTTRSKLPDHRASFLSFASLSVVVVVGRQVN